MAGISRRKALAGAAAFFGGIVTAALRAVAQRMAPMPGTPEAIEAPWLLQGRSPSELGKRSRFVQLTRRIDQPLPSSDSMTPLHLLDGVITPADLHFERHHAGIPDIDPSRYKLVIHGLVDRPMVFTLADLQRLPQGSRIMFVECSGNGFRGYRRRDLRPDQTRQQIDGLTSTSEWTGVPLAVLFREVGVKASATWFLAEGMDAALMTRSIPVAKAWDDAMIALAQNGEPLRPEQGYPARLLLPGWEGNTNVKWIRRLELADAPFMTREETSKYSDPLPDCTARLFSFEMDAKSAITYPTYPVVLSGAGWYEIKGLSWSGRGRIVRVEVSVDGGAHWQSARLDEPVLPKAHTRFRLPWRWDGRAALLMSRAVDETGYIQPTRKQLLAARGAGTSYHMNSIRTWRIASSGAVTFATDV